MPIVLLQLCRYMLYTRSITIQMSSFFVLHCIKLSGMYVHWEYSGKLSAFCGCAIYAGTGMACALAWFKKAPAQKRWKKIINNMASSITGMICDGGNQGCTMKRYCGSRRSCDSVELAMDDVYIYNAHVALMVQLGRDHAQYGTDCVTWYDRNRERPLWIFLTERISNIVQNL